VVPSTEWSQAGLRSGPDFFLNPMNWLLERTVHRGMVGTSVGSELFSDLDFADDLALLSEMLPTPHWQPGYNGHSVEVVESFPCLGCLIHCTGDSAPEIKCRVSITRDCMMALDRNIWRSCISVGTKLRLYNSCFLPIFLYGAETWSVTATAAKTLDALDQRSTPHPENTLDRAHHQQRDPIKNPTTITV